MGEAAARAAIELPLWLELLGLVVGTVGCALTACERKLDVIGCVGLGMLGGLGGGLLRDMIMQVGTVYAIDTVYAIPVSVGVGLLVFFFNGLVEKVPDALEWLDILAVALFAVSGADKAIVWGLTLPATVLMGVLTANGGGLMRDVVIGDVPRLFQRGNWYAICSLAGSLVYWVLVVALGVGKGASGAVTVAVIVLLRRASLRFNLLSPADVDLSPQITGRLRRLTRSRRPRRR